MLGMSKTGSGKSSKGGSSKGSASSFTDTVTRSKALQTPAEQLVLLRSALRSDDGVKDRDVSADLLPQLLVYQRAVELSTKQLVDKRLYGAQDIAWALINNPAFLFNH